MPNYASAAAAVLAGVCDVLVAPAFCRAGFALRQATWPAADLDVDLTGRRYVITGANSGLGRATALALAMRRATVELVCRDRQRGEQALAELGAESGNPALTLHVADVSLVADVRRLAAVLQGAGTPLHGLAHNAGILPAERQETTEGLEQTFATNVLGPFLLTQLLTPALALGAADSPARVVFVSSGGMYTQRLNLDDLQFRAPPFDGVTAYAQTKRAEVLLAERFAATLADRHIVVNSMHPGWADTPGVQSSLPRFRQLTRPFLRNSAEGADTIVWLLVAEAASQQTGRFFFDRKARRTHLPLLHTQSSAAEVDRLWATLSELADRT